MQKDEMTKTSAKLGTCNLTMQYLLQKSYNYAMKFKQSYSEDAIAI